jgi:hypothetical protein
VTGGERKAELHPAQPPALQVRQRHRDHRPDRGDQRGPGARSLPHEASEPGRVDGFVPIELHGAIGDEESAALAARG